MIQQKEELKQELSSQVLADIIKTFYEQNYNGATHPITDEKCNRVSMVRILDKYSMKHVYTK